MMNEDEGNENDNGRHHHFNETSRGEVEGGRFGWNGDEVRAHSDNHHRRLHSYLRE